MPNIRDLQPLFGNDFWCIPLTEGRADCFILSAVDDYRIVNPDKCSLVLRYSPTFQALVVSFNVEDVNVKNSPLPCAEEDKVAFYANKLEKRRFWDVLEKQWLTVVKVEYSATKFQEQRVLKSGKNGKRTAAAEIIVWALADGEEDEEGNTLQVEEVSNERDLWERHCYPYDPYCFNNADNIEGCCVIPHNDDYTAPPLVQDTSSTSATTVRLRREKSQFAQMVKKCIQDYGGVPKLIDGSVDPSNGNTTVLSWILAELAKFVDDEMAITVDINGKLGELLGYYTLKYIFDGFRKKFPDFLFDEQSLFLKANNRSGTIKTAFVKLFLSAPCEKHT